MSESYQLRLERIRRHYPRAYTPWTEADNEYLTIASTNGTPVHEMVEHLRRQPSAIRSRLRKLTTQRKEVEPKHEALVAAGFEIHLAIVWQSVLSDQGVVYRFPQPITPFMVYKYKRPAVYRWRIYHHNPVQVVALYIGQTTCLCPKRLNGYLHPKDSVTNRRLYQSFSDYLEQGYQVELDVLEFDKSKLNSLHFGNLEKRSQRTLLEELVIHFYRQNGIHLLNL